MNLPRFSVRNPVAVNLLMWAIITTGVYSWFTLIREFFPNVEPEEVRITVPYPGATPEEVEKSVTRIIEREVEGIQDVERVEARVFEGLSLVTVRMEENADRDRVVSDIRAAIDRAQPDLPAGAEQPQVVESRPTVPVIAVVVHGRAPETVHHEAALRVRDALLDLPEVSEILVSGLRDRELLIEIQPELLEVFGLSFEEVGRALARTNLDVPGGQLKGTRTNIRVRTVGEEQRALPLEDLVLRTGADGSTVRLRDVAVLRDGFEDRVERGRFVPADGRAAAGRETGAADLVDERAATITVFQMPDQDAIEISEAVKRWVSDHPTVAGGALQISATTDLARFIEQRLELMTRNARAGLLLVLITLAIFLELRVALWVAIGLVVSFAGTFLVMLVLGATINLISLFGLIVVLGLIVDDAIVIGENIFTKLRAGVPPLRAAEEGANEVGGPVLAAVLTTVGAFVPLAFIEGRMGSFLGVLPVVVIAALSVSLIEAFIVLPSHLAHRPKRGGDSRLSRLYRAFGEAKHRVFEERLPRRLEGVLRRVLAWRYVTAATAVALLLAAAGLVAGGIVPFVLLQDTDAETVTAKLEMAAGTPERVTLETLARAERVALSQPEVASAFTVVGSSFGDRGLELASDPATVGQLILELKPAEERRARGLGTSQDLLVRLRRETADFPGVRRLAWAARGGGPQGADVEVLVRGDDLAEVQPAVLWVKEALAAYTGVDEIYDDLEIGKLEARLRLLPTGRLVGLTTESLALQVRHALFGIEAQDLQIGDEEVTVRVVLPESARRGLEDLERFRIQTPTGGRVPLSEAAGIETARGYASLTRVDGKRAVRVTAEVDETLNNVTNVTNSLTRDTAGLGARFPGVNVAFEGQRKEVRESLGSLAIGFPAALLAIFSIIAVVFRSYVQPIIVMLAIPFGLVGGIFGHWLMGFPFTLLSMIGAVALTGIVVNDGLILVDFANRARRGGERALEAVVHASKARLRPILLTSITTIAGLAPLMLEQSFQAQFLIPMAISIVFGLMFATVLTLLLLPTFYLIFEDARRLLRWAWTGRYVRELPYDPGFEEQAQTS